MRDGLGVRAERGGVRSPSSAASCSTRSSAWRRTSLGVSQGRITAIGRAGNPDTMDGVGVVLDTAVCSTPPACRHAGRRRPARAPAVAPGRGRRAGRGSPRLRGPGLRPGVNLDEPGRGAGRHLGGPRGVPAQRRPARARLPRPGLSRGRSRCGWAAYFKIPRTSRPAPSRSGAPSTWLIATTSSSRSISTASTRRGRSRIRWRPSGGARPRPRRGLRRRPRAGPARARRPRASSPPRRPPRCPTAPRPGGWSTWRWCRRCTCSIPTAGRGTRGWWLVVRPADHAAAEGVLHDLGVISMLSSDSQGMGRIGEVVRRVPERRRHEAAARPRGRPGRQRSARVTSSPRSRSTPPMRTASPATWGRRARQARRRGAVAPRALRRALSLWSRRASRRGRRGRCATRAPCCASLSGGRQLGGLGAAAARLSLAFLARCADGRRPAHDASARDGGELPRPAGRGHGAQRLHGGRAVHLTSHEVTLDGEPVAAPPIEELAFSGRFPLG